MSLTPLQTELLQLLRVAVASGSQRQIVYHSEYLGWLPYGQYHWINKDDQDISRTFPAPMIFEWERSDLDSLVAAGHLCHIGEWRNPSEECEISVTYEVLPVGP